jgi:hypothetical protein
MNWIVNSCILCPLCLERLDALGILYKKEWALTCRHACDGNIRAVYERESLNEKLEILEKMRYIVTTEHENMLLIKPIGHEVFKNTHFFCAEFIHK